MTTPRLVSLGLWCVVITTSSMALRFASAELRPAHSILSGTQAPPVIPARRAPGSPAAPPPEVPAAAANVTPLTIETHIRRQAGSRVENVRQTVSRTVDRVHIAGTDGREWLFERNLRDHRRVFGTLIDHAARALVLHDESDLRNMLGFRGWAQVLSLGSDPGSVERTGVDADVLRPASERFPTYRVVDLAEWLERN